MTRAMETTEQRCFHCGEPIPPGTDLAVTIEGKARPVCCAGCQAVAQSIVDAGLEEYYEHRREKAVTADVVPEMIRRVDAIADKFAIPIVNYGHAGDGNIHVNIMLDRSIPEEAARAEQAKEQLFSQTIALGGTLSGEHGIGLSKKAFMRYELNEATLELMKRIKTLFDPNNILNPGKIFPT